MITRRLSLSSINKTAPYQVWTENGYTYATLMMDGNHLGKDCFQSGFIPTQRKIDSFMNTRN